MRKGACREQLFRSTLPGTTRGLVLELSKFLLFSLVVVGAFSRLVLPQFENSYNACIVDKEKRLASLQGPKIVLLGNSNLAFGIRSELIQDAFGREVVNMGLNAALGNRFHEKMARSHYIRRGDVVVLCPTHFAEAGERLDPIQCWSTIENHFSVWGYVPVDEWYSMAKAFPVYARSSIDFFLKGTGNEVPKPAYWRRSSFNRYGDNIAAILQPEQYRFPIAFTSGIPTVSVKVTRRLNRLHASLARKGVRLFIAAYPIPYKEADGNRAIFSSFQPDLQQYLDFPVISDYSDYLFDYSCFYNSIAHLTDAGAVLRTRQLIEDLRPYIGEPGSGAGKAGADDVPRP